MKKLGKNYEKTWKKLWKITLRKLGENYEKTWKKL